MRLGYKGPIELALAGLDEKCQLSGATIPDGKTVTTLTVTIPKSLAAGACRPGRCRLSVGPRSTTSLFEARVETLAVLRTALNGVPNPPAALDGQFVVGVGPVFPEFVKLAVDNKTIDFVQLLGTTGFSKLKATRLEKFADAIAVTAEGLPAEFQIKAATLDKGKNELALEVAGPRTIAEGDYPVPADRHGDTPESARPIRVGSYVACRAAVGSQGFGLGQVADRRQAKAEGADYAHHGRPRPRASGLAIVAGGGEDPRNGATIAEGQNEAELEVSVEAGARPGTVPAVLVATAKIRDQEITVASEPIVLEIVRP